MTDICGWRLSLAFLPLSLRCLSAYRQQNSLAAAWREIERIERTLFTLRWFEDPALRQLVTAELNKGKARNTLARAVAFHRLGRFLGRSHENQASRAAALNLVTAAIVLFNCRYLGRITEAKRRQGRPFDEKMIPKLSPLGWDHINITGDYVWSDALEVDEEGFLPIRSAPSRAENRLPYICVPIMYWSPPCDCWSGC